MITRVKTWLDEEFSFLEGNFLVLMQCYVLSGFASGLWSLFRPDYILSLGASTLQLGFISSVGSAISAVIAIPGAYIADRYGRKRVIVVFTYFVVIGYLIHAFAPNWWWILIGSVVLNLSCVYMPALEAVEADSLPEEKRGMGYSLISMAPSVFSAISPPIAGLVVSRYEIVPGMRILYVVTAGIILVIALLRTIRLEETLHVKPTEVDGLWNHVKDSITQFKQAASEVKGKLRWFFLVEILFAFEIPVFDVFLTLYVLDNLAIPKVQWGLLNSVFMPLSLLLSIPVGKLVDKTPRRQSLLLAYLFSATVGVFVAYASGARFVLMALIMRGIGQTISFPAVHALRADLIPTEKRGRLMGLLTVVKRLAAVPTALLFAWMFDMAPRSVFISSTALNIASLFVIYLAFSEKNHR